MLTSVEQDSYYIHLYLFKCSIFFLSMPQLFLHYHNCIELAMAAIVRKLVANLIIVTAADPQVGPPRRDSQNFLTV